VSLEQVQPTQGALPKQQCLCRVEAQTTGGIGSIQKILEHSVYKKKFKRYDSVIIASNVAV
jgi:hypothetical protein